jgi:hypothetical protein
MGPPVDQNGGWYFPVAATTGRCMVVDEDMRDVVLIVDALFRSIAEKAAESEGVPAEVAIEGAWTLFGGGFLRLVVGDDEHPLRKPRRAPSVST